MKKAIKALLWITGTLVALLIAAVIIIPLVFDPNDHKDDIAAAVKKSTGRALIFHGGLKLSLFPWIGVETGGLELGNAPGFEGPFLKINGAAVRVRLLPLFEKRIEVDTITLDTPYVALATDKDGRTSWTDLAGPKTPPAEPQAESAAPGIDIAALAIGGIHITNGAVLFRNDQTGAHYELSNANLRTGPITLTGPVDIAADFDVKSAAPEMRGHLALATRAQFDRATQQLRLANLDLRTQMEGARLPAKNIDGTLTAQVLLDLAAQRHTLKDLHLTAQLRGGALPAESVALALDTQAALDVAAEHYRFEKTRINATLRGANIPGGELSASITAAIDANLREQTAAIDDLDIEVLGLKAQGRVHTSHLLEETPRFNGELTSAPFNARALLEKFSSTPLVTADPNAFTHAAFKARFDGSTTEARLGDFEFLLDQTRINGNASVRNFAKPALKFKLAVDTIDADRYLTPPPPKTTTSAAETPTPATATAAAAEPLPLDTLRALDLDGAFTVGKFKISNLNFQDIAVTVRAKDGLIRAQPLAAKMYGGAYKGDIQLDARGGTPLISMDESLTGIQIGSLTQDYLQQDIVSGTGNLALKLSAKGITPASARATLNGQVSFSFTNGGVKGVNLARLVKEDYAKHLEKLAPEPGALDRTVFSRFGASAMITDGLIATQDLALDSAQLNVKGRGAASLVDEKINLRLDVTPAGQLAKELGKFKDVKVPVKVGGTLLAPTFKTELDDALKNLAKARLEEEKQKLEAELEAKKAAAEAELRRKAEEEKAKLQQQLDAQKQEAQQKLEKKAEEAKKKAEQQIEKKLKDFLKSN